MVTIVILQVWHLEITTEMIHHKAQNAELGRGGQIIWCLRTQISRAAQSHDVIYYFNKKLRNPADYAITSFIAAPYDRFQLEFRPVEHQQSYQDNKID